MGYQALLFCPDEKLARVVSQVFSELDFTVEPVHEPFAAVKKLMSQRYDAIVVDCENEQNASLLFKSARNSSSNQSSLAIALVEGQAGVAKAYRIGANLVLTKPINVEQAKGTLRVARGLLRKNSDAASASATSAATLAMPAKTPPASADNSFQPPSRGAAASTPPLSRQELPEFEAPLLEMIPETRPAAIPAILASAKVEDKPAAVPGSAPQAKIRMTTADEPAVQASQPPSLWAVSNDTVKNDLVKNEATKIAAASVPAQNPSSAFASPPGSAAAPAPAKEVAAPPAPAKENGTVESEPASPSHANSSHANSSHANSSHANPSHDADPAPAPAPTFSMVSAIDAPSFAALGEEDSGGSGVHKKILIAAVAVLALAVLGYLGYGKLGKSSAQPLSTPQDSRQPAAAPAPTFSPVGAPSTGTPGRASSVTQTSAPKTATVAPPDKPSAGVADSPVIRIAANIGASPEPETKEHDSAPIHVKTTRAKTPAQGEESAPPLPSPLAVASANDHNLSGLMASASSSVPRPSLATIRISQGVSQGLLIKRVQPKYPPAALAVRAQGAVQIEATINKEGNVTNLKVLSGDPVLARAALEAVRQWRYKPYYLDGDPVEIQTQITVNFKAN
jgi:protein TonB